jgi:hypothetical protein
MKRPDARLLIAYSLFKDNNWYYMEDDDGVDGSNGLYRGGRHNGSYTG